MYEYRARLIKGLLVMTILAYCVKEFVNISGKEFVNISGNICK